MSIGEPPQGTDRTASVVSPLTSDIEDEARWDRAFAASRPVLERLAAEAAEERRLGLTEELDPTRL